MTSHKDVHKVITTVITQYILMLFIFIFLKKINKYKIINVKKEFINKDYTGLLIHSSIIAVTFDVFCWVTMSPWQLTLIKYFVGLDTSVKAPSLFCVLKQFFALYLKTYFCSHTVKVPVLLTY